MSSHASSLTLLLLTSDHAGAERLVGRLRALGLPARALATAKVERLDELLERRAFDAVLWLPDAGAEVETILERHAQRALEVPLIMIGDPRASEDLATAKRLGARDLVLGDQDEWLSWVIRREAADHRQRRRARELGTRLAQCDRRARALLERLDSAVVLLQDGQCLDANSAYLEWLGAHSLDAILGRSFSERAPPDERDALLDLLQSLEQPERSDPITTQLRLQNERGETLAFECTASRVWHTGTSCIQLILTPVERAKSAPRTVAAHRDPTLSVGAGRANLFAQIESRLDAERAVTEPFALFFIRVIHNAELLRDLGLTHGLDLIEQLGASLDAIITEPHRLTRVSDDGFATLVDGVDETAAEALAERIRMEARLPEHGGTRALGEHDCEVGYYLVKGRAAAAADILNAAHRLSVYVGASPVDQHSGMQTPTSLASRNKQAAVDGDSEIAETIQLALRDDQFKLVYQPIISLMGDSQENYSVLVRLLDPSGNLLEAKDFIGAAIRAGLIEDIDRWSIRTAIKVLGEQRLAGHNPRFFINLAEDTFRNPNIIIWICDCLRELDARGNWLTFQFQEETVLDNLASLGKLVEALKQIKCRVAINRFGGSSRSEMLLQALQVDYVVLTPDFARGLADDLTKQQRLLALANLTREFNVKSVVTGVEDARSLTVLWTAGVDYVQGNFLQRPSPTLDIQP